MRRTTAIALGAALSVTSVGVGTTAAIGAAAPRTAYAQARHIADSLARPNTRAHYGLDRGTLVAVDVCVRGACVHRQFQPEPTCPPGDTCVGTALVIRRLPRGVTISAEVS